ncbi:MAG: bifunctional phosphoribosylaminoimidazolecarboxamide formyltransferase/IMP cyclohydrolase, partial [candidate division NC10 bacterium]|nr:bifunctional phosphoribosylaminoimidazolecarboxamide formyltransferase/IMP cyclohydrolase [candidate division NC10 bacterium]
RLLREAGIRVKEVSEVTGFPEMLDGRVKTLHPLVHGAILAKRSDPAHRQQMEEHEILPIDLVAINLYPFEQATAKEGCTFEEAIENIDIGGPAMIRSASKNFQDVTVLTDPSDYPLILHELQANQGVVAEATNLRLAQKAFRHTARYDGLIASYLSECRPQGDNLAIEHRPVSTFPSLLYLQLEKVQDLRYGENPHQRAAFYSEPAPVIPSLTSSRQLQGKELSFNNLLDLDAALNLALEFKEPVAVIIKHNNPCGVAVAQGLVEAYRKARSTDPVSAFGGIVGCNRPVDVEMARELASTFLEAVIAPAFSPEALAALEAKKDLRLMETGPWPADAFSQGGWDMKRVRGGMVVQDRDTGRLKEEQLQVVTKRPPTEAEMRGLRFAWKVIKHVKSNAILLANPDQTVGIGAGQMSRVDSVKVAVMKAQFPTRGTVLASDAFFPFRDGIDEAAKAGVTAIIQPGGSVRDAEAIQAADEHGMAMVFTGIRHFKH